MTEREFTYFEGIIEGRLIENGFMAIGKSMFVHRLGNMIYIVTFPEERECLFEAIEINSPQPEPEMEYSSFVEWARADDINHTHLKLRGHIYDIIEIAKIAKSHYK